MGVFCTWVKQILQILGCELHKNARGIDGRGRGERARLEFFQGPHVPSYATGAILANEKKIAKCY